MRPWQWLLAVVLSLLSSGAMALGLGQIRVLSAPGQPLLAEIPIISNEPGELENARARLASPETFARVGLQPPAGLVRDLQFEIAADAQGRAVVRVTSSAPVDVPAVAFLIEVDWGQGRLVREYSALVAAPQTAAAIEAPAIQTPQAAPSDAIVREPAPAVADAPVPPEPADSTASATPAPPAPPAPAPAVAPTPPPPPQDSAAAGEVLATVRRGQTLSGIAAGMDRQGHSLTRRCWPCSTPTPRPSSAATSTACAAAPCCGCRRRRTSPRPTRPPPRPWSASRPRSGAKPRARCSNRPMQEPQQRPRRRPPPLRPRRGGAGVRGAAGDRTGGRGGRYPGNGIRARHRW